ncbi:hypothetical protein OFY05_14425 [Pseudocitrobacter faecalis]|nr:hypothetical protein OFY05_14425 [Pseudocitrobacter faecalis]
MPEKDISNKRDNVMNYPFDKNDANAWLLALLPLILMLLGFVIEDNTLSVIGLGASFGAVFGDRKVLLKEEKPAPSLWWFLISPVYLWKRDAWQQKPKHLFQAWIVATILMLAGTWLQVSNDTSSALAESACPTVTQIMRENNERATCVQISDMKEEVSGRFYSARALMSTGKKMPVTIEVRDDGTFYVTIPNMNDAY